MADDDFCYVTTTGRRSGRPHRIEIWYAGEAPTLYLLSGGGRSADWVQNLAVDPTVSVELAGRVRSGRARIINDDAEDRWARAEVFGKYAPRTSDDLTNWRERALPIAIDIDDE